VRGEDKLTHFESENGGGKTFCSICGSTLCGTVKGEVHGVTLGCVDGDPGVSIGMHIYVGSKAPWEVLPEGLPGEVLVCVEGPPARLRSNPGKQKSEEQ
jgi:hypothetical protein